MQSLKVDIILIMQLLANHVELIVLISCITTISLAVLSPNNALQICINVLLEFVQLETPVRVLTVDLDTNATMECALPYLGIVLVTRTVLMEKSA